MTSVSGSLIRSRSRSVTCNVPYANPELIDGLHSSASRSSLCALRNKLFEGAINSTDSVVIAGRKRMPDYSGTTLGDDNRLSNRQIIILREGLVKLYSRHVTSFPTLDIDTLVSCKIVVGRWLRPAEMKAVFGKHVALYFKRFVLMEHKSDPRVDTGGDNARVGFAIGRNGSALNNITARSGCMYLWLKPPSRAGARATLIAYARGESLHKATVSLEKAAMLLSKQQSYFRAPGNASSPMHGFKVISSTTPAKEVSMSHLYGWLPM